MPQTTKFGIEYPPVVLHTRPALEMNEEQFFEFCQLNRYWRIERTAPFGRMKPPLEAKATPVASCLLHSCTWAVSSAFLLLVSPPVGGMISRLPSAVRSPDAS
jgi:hypothetical protein